VADGHGAAVSDDEHTTTVTAGRDGRPALT
jgi:hypothetical protein